MARGRGGHGGSRGRSHGSHRSHGIGHRHGHGHFGGINHHHHGIGMRHGPGFSHHHRGIHHRSSLFGRGGLFGRRRGFGHHTSFRTHYRGGFGGGGASFGMNYYYDMVAANPMPPRINNGCYSFSGNSMSCINNLQSFPTFYQTQLDANGQPVPLNQASFYVVGNKTHQADNCCYTATIMLGICLIFPCFFMCCNWWKKMVYPQYEVNPEAYRAMANFIASTNVNNVTVEVVDNAFSSEKAGILLQVLRGKTMVGFTFINHAQPLDYNNNEYQNFQMNVMGFKELPFENSLQWDDTVI